MRRLDSNAVLIALVLLPLAAWSQTRSGGSQDDAAKPRGGDGESPPTVDELVGDALHHLQWVDRRSAKAISARLSETEVELRLLNGLLTRVQGGLLVDAPGTGRSMEDATEAARAENVRRVEELRSRLALANEMKRAPVAAPTRTEAETPPKPTRATAIGSALLAVDLDVPVTAPRAAESKPAPRAMALDPKGLSRALYAAEDFSGALEAANQIPEDARTSEDRYRIARSLDRLDRWTEAKAAYEALAKADPEGHWGRQASWMLRIGGGRKGVDDAVKKRIDRVKQTGEKQQ